MTQKKINISSIPAIKPTVQRNDLEGTIFLRTSSRVTEISPDTIYRKLADQFNGESTLSQIINSLSLDGYTEEEVLSAFKEFDDLLLLEDSSITSDLLTHEEKQRWSRNLNFLGSFCSYGENKELPQKKIRDCKVTLLGLGGLGCHILYDLAALGCKDICAVEFDNIEISNLNRQILYTPKDIGRPKAEVAHERIKQFSPDLKFTVFNKQISGVEDIIEAIKGRDIVICVADRPKTEILFWVNEACVKQNIPLITGGLDTQVCRYYCTLPGEGCLQCWRDSVQKNNPQAYLVLEEQRRTQLRGDNAAFVPFVALIAGFIISEFVKIVTGIGGHPVAHNKSHELNFKTMNMIATESWEKNPKCSCCSAK